VCVQKAVAKFVHRHATTLGNGPALTVRLKFPIALVHKHCRVQHLPLAACNTDKFGGWVKENYKSLCKLAPWLCHCFEDVALQKPVAFIMSTKPRHTWTLVENKGYLRSRGIPSPKAMRAAEAREAVKALFEQPGASEGVIFYFRPGFHASGICSNWWNPKS
jgi:hypothetical protein